MGTWKVNTMLKAGKMQEIADQIVRLIILF